MNQSCLVGSKIVTELKAIARKHTVSYTMLIDESIWNRHEKNPKNESYMELDKLASPLFSAEDDGEVLFKVWISKLPSDDRNVESPSKYQLHLDMVKKPLLITVHYVSYCRIFCKTFVETPFHNHPEGEPYKKTVHPNETKKRSTFSNTLFRDGIKSFRMDVTYLKVKQANQEFRPTTGNSVDLPKRCLGADLLKEISSSDISLKANGKEWKLHKCVLKARSDVFHAMFSSNMKESKEGVVEIKDAGTNAIDLMIKYIYTDVMDDSVDMDHTTTGELLILADKYNLPVLKEKCARRLVSQLSVENCLQLCAFASKYNSEFLLTASKKIIANNLEDFCKNSTDEFKDFVRDNCDLHLDILRMKLLIEK